MEPKYYTRQHLLYWSLENSDELLVAYAVFSPILVKDRDSAQEQIRGMTFPQEKVSREELSQISRVNGIPLHYEGVMYEEDAEKQYEIIQERGISALTQHLDSLITAKFPENESDLIRALESAGEHHMEYFKHKELSQKEMKNHAFRLGAKYNPFTRIYFKSIREKDEVLFRKTIENMMHVAYENYELIDREGLI